MNKSSVLTINQLIKRSFLIPSIVVFIAVFSVATFFSYKTFQDSQAENLVNTHVIITRLISPSLLIADSQNVRKVLTLTTQPSQILAIIDNNNDIIMPDYANLKVVDGVINVKKHIDACSEKSSSHVLNVDNVRYRVFCSFIDYPYGHTVETPSSHLGILLSFTKINFFPFSATLFLYIISVVTIIILFLTRWIYISLKKGLLYPFNNFKNHVMNESYEKENLENVFYTKNAMKEVLEFGQLFERYVEKINKRSLVEKQAAIGRVALQLVHDIRSPVAAMMMLTKDCKEIPEAQRICLREAAERIQDIANLLLVRHGRSEGFSKDYQLSPVLASTAVLSVLSSKRVEYKHKRIKFDFTAGAKIYFSFIQANTTEFKRVISNLINNAVEAIDIEQGTVFIALQKDVENNQLIITIQDTGCGMSEEKVRHLLSDQLVETSKKDGHGLGLSHTKETLIKLNASFCIKSEINKGTSVFLKIPLVETPHWIASEITVHPNDCVIILDDDHSIHGAWDKLFLEKHPELKLVHFTDAEQCMEYIVSFEQPDRLMLLTDYELIGQKYNGLDVVEKVNLPRSILVTSHYENSEIIERAVKLKIKILPKTLAVYASITILSDALLSHDAENTSPDLILIDNDNLILNVWEYSARTHNKMILSFNNFFDAEKAIQGFERSTPIYIDSDLGDELPGEEYAKILYDQGFRQIYLTTGYEPSSFKSMYWIKGIVGKTPAF